MLKKFLASAATVLLAASMSVVSFAMPAAGTGTDTPPDVPSTSAPTDEGSEEGAEEGESGGKALAEASRVSVATTTSTPTPSPTPTDEAECIPRSAVSYTYNNLDNSGEIIVADVPGSTGVLCLGFWVTATSWQFTTTGNMWPQVLDKANKLPKITAPGTYPFTAPVTCGQGDIYASFIAQPNPTPVLNGPSDPFPESFLHNMVFATSTPGTTYMVDSTDCTIEEPASSVVEGSCVYTDSVAASRTVTITFDNTGSNVPVAFTVPYFPQYDQVVPARGTVTFAAANMYQVGGSYEVKAAGKTFTLVISPCPEIPKPNGERSTSADKLDCSTKTVTVTTTTYVTPYTFNADTLTWDEGEEGPGVAVDTVRPMTADEKAKNCVIPTDPTASSCTNKGDNELTRWIRVGTAVGVAYFIDGVATVAEYTEVAVGAHTVTAVAAEGYKLDPGATASWKLTVADTVFCKDFPTLATVTPTLSSTQMTCTTAGSYTIGAVDPGTISWTVNGVAKAPGTYKVSSAQSITLVASKVKPLDGLEDGWINPKVLVFAAATGACDLTTLALTGSVTTGVLALGGSILVVGIGALLIARRRTTTNT